MELSRLNSTHHDRVSPAFLAHRSTRKVCASSHPQHRWFKCMRHVQVWIWYSKVSLLISTLLYIEVHVNQQAGPEGGSLNPIDPPPPGSAPVLQPTLAYSDLLAHQYICYVRKYVVNSGCKDESFRQITYIHTYMYIPTAP